MNLLARARAAGLSVSRHGEKLVVRGSEGSGAVARELLAAKVEVLAALDVEAVLSAPLSEAGIAECRQRLLDAGDLIRELARSRWGAEADRWPVEMLAGLFVREALAGLEAGLGSWEGWDAIRARLDHQTGPTAIVRVWAAYAALLPERRAEVIARGDRAQSPPACRGELPHA